MTDAITMYDYAITLASIRSIAPEAHIAGGAVRDTILKKPIHDIDIFMDDANLDAVAEYLRPAYRYVKVGEWKSYLGFSDPAMTRLAKFERADEPLPVCLIGLQSAYASPEENISRFDFGICMAAFDGTTVLRSTKFDDDVEAKTFTLHRADNDEQFAYSLSRYKKITAGRYAGWGLSIPEEFAELVKEHTMRTHWYREEGKFMDGPSVLRPKERRVQNA